MAEIDIEVQPDKELTVISATGLLTSQEIIDALKQMYDTAFTKNVLWDLCGADLSTLESDQLPEIIEFAKQYAHLREGGRTAFLLTSDFGYGMSRMYEILSELLNHPLSHAVFRDIESAMIWLETGEK